MAASPIIGVDIDGVVTLFNSAAEVLTGWPLGEITGRPLWEHLLDPEDSARFQALLRGLAKEAPPDRFDLALRTHSGEIREICWAFRVLRDEDGRVEQLLGTGEEIGHPADGVSASRRSETSFRSLIELMPDAVAVHRDGVPAATA